MYKQEIKRKRIRIKVAPKLSWITFQIRNLYIQTNGVKYIRNRSENIFGVFSKNNAQKQEKLKVINLLLCV